MDDERERRLRVVLASIRQYAHLHCQSVQQWGVGRFCGLICNSHNRHVQHALQFRLHVRRHRQLSLGHQRYRDDHQCLWYCVRNTSGHCNCDLQVTLSRFSTQACLTLPAALARTGRFALRLKKPLRLAPEVPCGRALPDCRLQFKEYVPNQRFQRISHAQLTNTQKPLSTG